MVAIWAQEEMSLADLGDERLDARIAVVLSELGNRPNMSIPGACKGRAEMQAAYRLFDNDKVTFQNVLAPHRQRTLERMAGHPVVLVVQDSSEIDLTRPRQDVAGAGTLNGSRRGVVLHLLQGFTPDGTPLGTVWAECQNRTQEKIQETPVQKRTRLRNTPIEEKESMRWVTGLRKTREVAALLPQTRCISVADSEADIYELLSEPLAEPDQAPSTGSPSTGSGQAGQAPSTGSGQAEDGPKVHWLIRACQDRSLDAKEHEQYRHLEEQARLVVEYYCVRWNIEILFRTLKSGCRIEQRRFEHVDRIYRCLALYLIVAWRTLFVCRMGRECPDADCETLFEPSEWKAVWVAVNGKKPPKKKPRLSEMIHLIARLGGYIERPESEPGSQTVWIGLQRMYDLAWAWDTFGPNGKIRDA